MFWDLSQLLWKKKKKKLVKRMLEFCDKYLCHLFIIKRINNQLRKQNLFSPRNYFLEIFLLFVLHKLKSLEIKTYSLLMWEEVKKLFKKNKYLNIFYTAQFSILV